MSFKVQNPISKEKAKSVLAVVKDRIKIEREFISEDEQEKWEPVIDHSLFYGGALVLVERWGSSVSDNGDIYYPVRSSSFATLKERVAVIVGRTSCPKLGLGPYLVYMRNDEQGYVAPHNIMPIRLSFVQAWNGSDV